MGGRAATFEDFDAESRVADAPDDHVRELRLWLRLLTCTSLIEGEIRRRLRQDFGMTLPRFDCLAQLDRACGQMTLGELSRRMMVTNGNVTLLTERLEAEGLVRRTVSPADRRVVFIAMTAAGRRTFHKVAKVHADWLSEMLGGLDAAEVDGLMDMLARTKGSVRRALRNEAGGKGR